MAVALFISSFSTTPAGQLHCQAVIELSFSAPAQGDSSSAEFLTFTTKEAERGIFTHGRGYGYFPHPLRLFFFFFSLLLIIRVSLFAAWQPHCRAVRRFLTRWQIKVEIAKGKHVLERLGWFRSFLVLRWTEHDGMVKRQPQYIDITLRKFCGSTRWWKSKGEGWTEQMEVKIAPSCIITSENPAHHPRLVQYCGLRQGSSSFSSSFLCFAVCNPQLRALFPPIPPSTPSLPVHLTLLLFSSTGF